MNKILSILLLLSLALHTQPSQNQWDQVQKFEQEGRPKSALKVIEKIYQEAQKEGNQTAIIKSLLLQEKFKIPQQNMGLIPTINHLKQSIKTTKDPATKLILHSIVASLYQRYLDTHWYEIESRPQIPKEEQNEIQTWDLEHFTQAITQQHLKALDPLAQKIPIERYQAILLPAKNVEGLRPTLYDFLAFRALDFLNNPRYALSDPNAIYYLHAKEAFGSINTFIQHSFKTDHPQALTYQALRIYQKLLAFHQQNRHKEPLAHVNLARLNFVYDHFRGSKREIYYLDALNSLSSQDPQSEALYYHAKYYFDKGEFSKALSYANQGIKSQRPYLVNQSQILKNRILTQSAQLTMEQVNLPEENLLAKVEYKNLKKLYIKVLQLTPKAYQTLHQTYGPQQKEFLNTLPVYRTLQRDLPPAKDYKTHSTEISLGKYPLGIYLFLISKDQTFKTPTSMQVSFVSYLSFLNQAKELLILNRSTGKPMTGVEAKFYRTQYNPKNNLYKRELITTVTSDQQGRIAKPKFKHAYFIELRHGKDFLSSETPLYRPLNEDEGKTLSQKRIYFFTDRSIYQPDQVIAFKGLVLKQYPNDPPKILTRQHVKVSLIDPTGQRIARKNFATNQFGTFNGTFHLPKKSLLGQFSLKAEEGIIGQKYLDVEEYKRPKFEVQITPLQGDHRLGEKIKIQGDVKAYAGNTIDDATVRYHVYRTASFPWHDPWYPLPHANDTEIAIGEVTTNAQGEFSFHFKALADPTIPKSEQPNFTYQVTVEVTDSTGETHGATQYLHLGFVAVDVAMRIPSELKHSDAKKLILKTTNLDGVFVPLKGSILIEKILPPHKLYRQRYWSPIDRPSFTEEEFNATFEHYAYQEGVTQRQKIQTLHFNTKKSKELLLEGLDQGRYLLTLRTEDRYGNKIKKHQYLTIYQEDSPLPPYPTYLWQKLNQSQFEVGATATLTLKSSAPTAHLYLSLYHNDNTPQEDQWISLKHITKIPIPITTKDQGDLYYQVALIQDNRPYLQTGKVHVPWNSHLNIELTSFRDRLKPNEEEQWQINVRDPKQNSSQAEMVATIYDATLDQISPHRFDLPPLFPQHYLPYQKQWRAHGFNALNIHQTWSKDQPPMERNFERLNWFGLITHNHYPHYNEMMPTPLLHTVTAPNEESTTAPNTQSTKNAPKAPFNEERPSDVRQIRYETLMFEPHLKSDSSGNIQLNFKTNGALTRWKFLGFVHDKSLKTATLQKEFVTQKELMVTTNLPRFFRAGDQITLHEKIVNMSTHEVNGTCHLELINPVTKQPIYPNETFKKPFKIKPKGSTTVAFKLKIPTHSTPPAITHRVTVKSDHYQDGEQEQIPVLSNQTLITQALPLWVNAQSTRSFTLPHLKTGSPAQRTQVTLEFSNNPAWYALLSLPYLMEFPYSSNDTLFSHYFSNALAQKITNQSTHIQQLIASWQQKAPHQSPLEENPQLKSVLLEETPWVLQANDQTQQLQRLGEYFHPDRLKEESKKNFEQLMQNQNRDGGWGWFAGGTSNLKITQYILEGFGRLKKLGIDQRNNPHLQTALAYIDQQMMQHYHAIQKAVDTQKSRWKADHLDPEIIHYLYTRSLYQTKMSPELLHAYKYYLEQIEEYWVEKGLQEQVMMALTLYEKGHHKTAMKIVKSLKERAIVDPEQGVFFNYPKGSQWEERPIETQSMMITLFQRLDNDDSMIKGLKRWLLKQRQSHHWESTKATIYAIDALLSQGELGNKLQPVQITFYPTNTPLNQLLKKRPKSAHDTTGYLKLPLQPWESNLSKVELKNPNPIPAWGAIYWQQLQPLDQVSQTNPNSNPLHIQKKYYLIKSTPHKERLIPIKKSRLHVGDKINVQLHLRIDRDMEYIMIKDGRSSAFEPTNTRSQYKWQGDFGYYKSTKTSATYFFVDKLEKGTYIFEYPLFVTHQGSFSGGIATIESMYAPEFRDHSKGEIIHVK